MKSLRSLFGCLMAVAFLGMASAAVAQDFSTSPVPEGESAYFPMAPVSITQSSSLTILAGNSVSCNNGIGHTDNSYYRRFLLTTDHGIIAPYNVLSVDLGVEYANAGPPTQPVTVNLYTIPNGAPFVLANLTLIGSNTVNIADQQLTMLNVPVAGLVALPALQDLVVEVFTPNGQGPGNLFFIGSNKLPQTRLSYLRAPDCGVAQPTSTAALGFPGMHIVMVVNGNETPTPTAQSTLGRVRAIYR